MLPCQFSMPVREFADTASARALTRAMSMRGGASSITP
jgi:hypothetical protein